MFALGVVAALFAAATWAVGSVYFARALGASGGSSPAAANTFKNCLALGAFLLLLPLAGGVWPDGRAATLLVLSGVLGFAFGDSLYFAAITRCGIQTAASVALLYVPLAAVLDFLVYGAELSVWQVLGMVITLLGVLLVVTDGSAAPAGAPQDPRVKRQGIWLSLGVVVVIACAVVLGHGESSASGVFPMATLRMAGGVLGALPIALVLAARSGRVGRELASIAAPLRESSARPRALRIASGLAVAGLLPYHFAMRELPGGVGAILFATTPLFTLLLGRISGERYGVRGLLGTLIGFSGVGLIVLAT